MEIAFHGRYTEDVLKQALDARRTRLSKILPWLAIPPIAVGGILIPLLQGRRDPASYLVGIIVCVVWPLYLRFANRYIARRIVAGRKNIEGPLHGTMNEELVNLNSEFGSTRMPWGRFHHAVVTPRLIILFQAANLMQILPREFFGSDAEWEQVQTWARTKPPKAPPDSSVIRTAVIWAILVIVVFVVWSLMRSA